MENENRTDVPAQVSADLYHLYLNLDTGEWGDRADLALITLTLPELQRFRAMTYDGRREQWSGATRYFGDVAVARGTRRMLSSADLPKPTDPKPNE